MAEFLPSVLTEESGWGEAFNIELTPIARRQEHQTGYIADVDAWLAGTKDLQTWQSGELPAPVIDSLLTGTRRELPLNIPNAGQCPDLPADAVVESICTVDGDGITGRDQAHAPAAPTEVLRRHVAVQEMTVEAALTGDRGLAAAAFALDPLAGRGDLPPDRHHGGGAAGRHRPVAAAVRHDLGGTPACSWASSDSAPWGCP